jgi:hypothetical protein
MNKNERPGWVKHDGSAHCPVEVDTVVEIETWTTRTVIKAAKNIDWLFVKWYRPSQK